jgi:3-oxoacyl-[acyl-carrier-protein] synthase-1
MKQAVFVESHNILTSLGHSSIENFNALLDKKSGVEEQRIEEMDEAPVYCSLLKEDQLEIIAKNIQNQGTYTRFEKMMIASIKEALSNSTIAFQSKKTIFIFSTTKGNIELLEQEAFTENLQLRMSMQHSASLVCAYFNNTNTPVVVSNACISGVLAIVLARRMLETGQFENAVVVGADTISKFVYSGFKSFQALSPGSCKPFSVARDGINLGEAAATLILTTTKNINSEGKKFIKILGGAMTNDANHISGPSRTGQELSLAIDKALSESGLMPEAIDFVSAHGTATIYNDEMEAKAFQLAKLESIPVNSLKGYFGHTLGASGLVESIVSLMSLDAGIVIPILGLEESDGIPGIKICTQKIEKKMDHCLKTASGFGGCNAAVVFSKG